mmetsp:Transcript_14096/g.49624  ORF Transcript_14096/g.49624 Transcript_14096/m.49624 type:complete len:244 (-) Transcript_14096:271-1002(-)
MYKPIAGAGHATHRHSTCLPGSRPTATLAVCLCRGCRRRRAPHRLGRCRRRGERQARDRPGKGRYTDLALAAWVVNAELGEWPPTALRRALLANASATAPAVVPADEDRESYSAELTPGSDLVSRPDRCRDHRRLLRDRRAHGGRPHGAGRRSRRGRVDSPQLRGQLGGACQLRLQAPPVQIRRRRVVAGLHWELQPHMPMDALGRLLQEGPESVVAPSLQRLPLGLLQCVQLQRSHEGDMDT